MKRALILVAILSVLVVCARSAPLIQETERQPLGQKQNTQDKKNDSQNTRADPKQPVPTQSPSNQKYPDSQMKSFDYVFWGFWVNAILVLGTLVIAILLWSKLLLPNKMHGRPN